MHKQFVNITANRQKKINDGGKARFANQLVQELINWKQTRFFNVYDPIFQCLFEPELKSDNLDHYHEYHPE